MEKKFRSLGITVCGVLVVGSLASTAYGDRKCGTEGMKFRSTVTKSFGKLVGAAMKAHWPCHVARDADAISVDTDCNSPASMGGEFQEIFIDMRDKFLGQLSDSFMKGGSGASLLENFPNCPEPCKTQESISTPIGSGQELGRCLACVVNGQIQFRGEAIMGSPAEPIGDMEARCHAALGSGYAKRVLTALKARNKCQKAEEKNGNCLLTPCATTDPHGIIAKATTKINERIEAACTGADLSALDSCTAVDVNALKICVTSNGDGMIDALFAAGLELP